MRTCQERPESHPLCRLEKANMPMTISLSGPDNVGKTTQLELFPRSFSIVLIGGLHDCDTKISQMLKDGSLNDWWWNSSEEDFVCTVYAAVGRRYRDAKANESATFALFDRGKAMFDAVTAAVLATKSRDGDLHEARKRRDSILRENNFQIPDEEITILLKFGKTLEESVKLSLGRETRPVDDQYRRYQTLLQRELQHQEELGVYQHTIFADGIDTYRAVQDEIRRIVRSRSNDPRLTPMLSNLNYVYAFAGLSESGKSTFAQKLCDLYGSSVAFRSKIVYFNDEASEAMKKSIYDLPEKEQAMLLLHGLDRFSNRHYWLRIITIESLHRDNIAMWLKTWLGDKLRIVFVDASEAIRRERSEIPLNQLVINDAIKKERGADLIAQRADLIVNNNGLREDSVRQLFKFAE